MIKEIITALVSFFLGLLGGLLIQRYAFRLEQYSEKKKRVTPYIENLHPMFEILFGNCEHAVRLQEMNDMTERAKYISRICSSLDAYGIWFSEFIRNGLKPELQFINLELYASLHGINVYDQIAKEHGAEFVSQNLLRLKGDVVRTKKMLDQFFKP